MNREEFKEKNGIIGKSQEINDLTDIVMQVAPSDISVLILGESGVGKEIFAGALHYGSKRKAKPFVRVNSGAIPEGILESELFGHKKGSFTSAVSSRKGYFEIANGGTLFLDEIAEMPTTTQVKILRAIENKEFMSIGSETVTKVDVRFIAATNKNLQKEVDENRFREDLYFRLKAVTLNIPPLRKRKEDIEVLTHYFIELYSNDNQIRKPNLSDEAYQILIDYNWPGNVRELKNTLDTAIALNKGDKITASAFSSLIVQENLYEDGGRNLPVYLRKTPEEADRELLYRALFEIKKDLIELKDIIIHQQKEIVTNRGKDDDEILPLDEMEKESIKNALEKTRGSKRKAAKLLNISERTLYRKIKQYALQ